MTAEKLYINRGHLVLFTILLTLGLVALDQITKLLATQYLLPVGTAPLIPGIIELSYVLNDGAAFSFFSGNKFLLVGVTSVALIGLAVYLILKKPTNKREFYSWLLIFAGGVGNLIDRVLNGVVVDFFNLQFMNFAVFNVADIYVTCGVALLFTTICISEFKEYKKRKNATVEENKFETR